MEKLLLIRLIILLQGIAIFLITLLEYRRIKQVDNIYKIIEDMLDLEETQTLTISTIIRDLSRLKFKVFLLGHENIETEEEKKNGKGKHEI